MGRKRTRRKSEPCPTPSDPAEVDSTGNQSEPEWRTGGELPTSAACRKSSIKPVTRRGRKRKASLTKSDIDCGEKSKNDDSNQAQKDTSASVNPRKSGRMRTPVKRPDFVTTITKRTCSITKRKLLTTSDVDIPDSKSDTKALVDTKPGSKIVSQDGKSELEIPEVKSDVKTSEENTPVSKLSEGMPETRCKVVDDNSSRLTTPVAQTEAQTLVDGKGNSKENITRRKGRQRGRKRQVAGKKARAEKTPLPSFDDDDDDVFESSKAEQKGADITDLLTPPEGNVLKTHSRLYSSTNSMDSIDLEESDQSSDEDLPDVLSQESNKVQEGDIVWAKTRGFPFWPAVVKKLYKNRGKAAVFFVGELNKSNQKGKGVPTKALKPYSGSEKDLYIDAGMKHPKVTKEEFQEAVDLAENYITKRGLGKAQGASFFTIKDYSNITPTKSPSKYSLSLTYTPSMKAELPLQDSPSSPLTPPCEAPDSPIWKSGGALQLRENQDQSSDDAVVDGEDGETSDVDKETIEKRMALSKLENRLLKYITRRPTVKTHLIKIYRGETKSLRHELYFSTKSEDRSRLKYLRGFGPITDDDKQDELIMFLRKVFEENCVKKDSDDNNFVMRSYLADVWFPEAIIFALQKTHRVGHKKAEQLFVSEEKKAMEITGALDIHLPSYLTEEEKRELLENVPKRAARQLGLSPKQLGLL